MTERSEEMTESSEELRGTHEQIKVEVQVYKAGDTDVPAWFMDTVPVALPDGDGVGYNIHTDDGTLYVKQGDYVIQYQDGSLDTCSAYLFTQRFSKK